MQISIHLPLQNILVVICKIATAGVQDGQNNDKKKKTDTEEHNVFKDYQKKYDNLYISTCYCHNKQEPYFYIYFAVTIFSKMCSGLKVLYSGCTEEERGKKKKSFCDKSQLPSARSIQKWPNIIKDPFQNTASLTTRAKHPDIRQCLIINCNNYQSIN